MGIRSSLRDGCSDTKSCHILRVWRKVQSCLIEDLGVWGSLEPVRTHRAGRLHAGRRRHSRADTAQAVRLR